MTTIAISTAHAPQTLTLGLIRAVHKAIIEINGKVHVISTVNCIS